MEWLLSPIDPLRAHEVGLAVSWHGRLMVLGWGVVAPLSVLGARFYKIMPGQDWPRELDNRTWWHGHLIGAAVIALCTLVGLAIMWSPERKLDHPHVILGYVLMLVLAAQVLMGVLRGSKGGPTAPAPDGSLRGDHYDMTRRRRLFEAAHKAGGYVALALGVAVMLLGLWSANAPVWMWLALVSWWAVLVAAFVALQRRGMAIDTYQAIWGDDPGHPGNGMPPHGWGMRRPGDDTEGEGNVRRDRGHGLRNP